MTDPLYLDDLEVGMRFVSREEPVTVEAILAFASEFDPQPFHTDPAAAEQSFFGGLAASGWHTAAITMRLLTEAVPLANGVIGAGGEIAWPSPTRPGDRLHVDATIESITPSRSRPDRGSIVLAGETLNQDGEVRERLSARLLVFRREA